MRMMCKWTWLTLGRALAKGFRAKCRLSISKGPIYSLYLLISQNHKFNQMKIRSYNEGSKMFHEWLNMVAAIAKGSRVPTIVREVEMKERMASRILAEQRITVLEEKVKELEERLPKKKKAPDKKMTTAEIVLVFYYLFDALGVNFSNSYKTEWARFIQRVTGRCYNRIREALTIDFDSDITRKYLRDLSSLFSELFPGIEQKILNDLEPY